MAKGGEALGRWGLTYHTNPGHCHFFKKAYDIDICLVVLPPIPYHCMELGLHPIKQLRISLQGLKNVRIGVFEYSKCCRQAFGPRGQSICP